MKCEECIHYDVCIDHKECKHFSPSAQWLYSSYPVGELVYEVRKRQTEQKVYINGKLYRTDVDEHYIVDYPWSWVDAYRERGENKRVFTDIDDARKYIDKMNEKLKGESKA